MYGESTSASELRIQQLHIQHIRSNTQFDGENFCYISTNNILGRLKQCLRILARYKQMSEFERDRLMGLKEVD